MIIRIEIDIRWNSSIKWKRQG